MELTIEEYSNRLEQLYGLTDSVVNLVIAPNGIKLLLSIINRIQKQGKNSNDASIGNYSTKPAYFAQTSFLNPGAFKPQGKNISGSGDVLVPSYYKTPFGTIAAPLTPKTKKESKRKTSTYLQVKKNYQERTSMYLPQGYKEFRSIQGLQTEHVDQTYTGKTMAAYVAEIDGQSMVIGFNTELASKIRKGNEARFKAPIYSASEREIKTYSDAVNAQLTTLTRNTIEGITPTALVA